MLLHSATNILLDADSTKLDSIRLMQFHIHTVLSDTVGNLGRNIQLLGVMIKKVINNSFTNIRLAPNAVHDYGFADLHASKSLVKHWETFQVPPIDIDEKPTNIPIIAQLHQNYPNPFNPTTIIRYYLPKTSNVVLKIYSTLGQEVVALVSEAQTAGEKSVVPLHPQSSKTSFPFGV